MTQIVIHVIAIGIYTNRLSILDCTGIFWIGIESLRFLRSSEVTLEQGLLMEGGGEGGVSIYLSTSKLSIYVTKNGVIYIYCG